jgi:hypothetical protein
MRIPITGALSSVWEARSRLPSNVHALELQGERPEARALRGGGLELEPWQGPRVASADSTIAPGG